jgi:hypothetical protein
MKFNMEIKEIKQKKSASLDNVYSITLVTDDRGLMDLSNIPSDEVVEVIIRNPQEG